MTIKNQPPKKDKQTSSKLKSHVLKKYTINKMKGQHPEWEKMFMSYVSDKGLALIIYK